MCTLFTESGLTEYASISQKHVAVCAGCVHCLCFQTSSHTLFGHFISYTHIIPAPLQQHCYTLHCVGYNLQGVHYRELMDNMNACETDND